MLINSYSHIKKLSRKCKFSNIIIDFGQVFPLGYICKKIRIKDGEVVDVSYKSFDDMVTSWEQADYPRDKYIINIIKPIYDENKALQQRTVNIYKKKYKEYM